MTATINEIEITELVDFDATLACESFEPCPNEAVWKVIYYCTCKVSQLFCDQCMHDVVDDFELVHKFYSITCMLCNSEIHQVEAIKL